MATSSQQRTETAPKPPAGASRARYVVLWIAFAGLTLNYLDRANLAVALPFMQESLHLELTNAQKGLIFGAFFWAYDGFMLLAGWFADRAGPRRALTFAAVWWSIFTILTSFARGFWSLFAVRFALGAGESPAYPAATKANSRWFPRHERAFAAAVVDSGSRVGNTLALPIVTGLIALVSWHFSFIVLGVLGVIWAFVWYRFYRDPTEHPRANDLEREYILANGARLDENDDADAPQVKWRSLFRYRTVRGMMLGFFCLNFVIYFFLTWFPTYLKDARGMDLAQMGTLGMVPGICAVLLGWLAGRLGDRAVQRGADVTRVRKTVMVGGLLGGAVIVFAAMAANIYLALAFLAISYTSLAVAATGIWSLPGDVAPSSRHVASIGGIQNFASNIAGIISPYVMGVLLDMYKGNYLPSFLVAAVIAVIGAFTYAFVVGKAEPLPPLPARH
ncbi:MFS transporter, ACS family, glucarate transporter [Actinopolymorpha cephalotaxi]|uniref:ACS family glucarate transporter-like MFS transporter n=1 Tax=Actinopolymorpha cephalotaxi TaxID=504797 RepID=A0A1I2TI45_9ACTN|nr:MFS transporter [Actinopolymorpha cephalotaxi]NYH83101.1 ACS family glucarate transporter-like MFS transporter [Actinopolymorpha cephalotaxi]SFG64584.1 MFS transporter, ACS family, glucarate transporter [Actinopolymorpha cephalotaxi]